MHENDNSNVTNFDHKMKYINNDLEMIMCISLVMIEEGKVHRKT